MANRSISLEGMIWAEGAPDLPSSPVEGTTYRDSSISEAEINNAQPYGGKGDSSKFNELLYRFSALIDLAEQYGILPWCPLVDPYPVGAFVAGSDGRVYKCTVSNTNNDPVTTSGFWIDPFREGSETYAGLLQRATQTIVNAGTNDTMVVTPLKLKTYVNNFFYFGTPVAMVPYATPYFWTDNGSFFVPIYRSGSIVAMDFYIDIVTAVGGLSGPGVALYSIPVLLWSSFFSNMGYSHYENVINANSNESETIVVTIGGQILMSTSMSASKTYNFKCSFRAYAKNNL